AGPERRRPWRIKSAAQIFTHARGADNSVIAPVSLRDLLWVARSGTAEQTICWTTSLSYKVALLLSSW
ncbi:hypothetical protein, partial [Mesorhizobium sp. B2-5-4]|uniref:hypothetical protein n=1 Tax=Mesorhizobium sp. B2-5-4 TaxID=2589926 RepID=UPI001AEE41E6